MQQIVVKPKSYILWPVYLLIALCCAECSYFMRMQALTVRDVHTLVTQRDEYKTKFEAESAFLKTHVLAQEVK